MRNISDLTKRIIEFRNAREWKQFHNPKDVALSLTLEASELLEHFQWRNGAELEDYLETHKEEIGEELADVFYWVLLLSNDLGIDIADALRKKMLKNKEKYPVGKFKNNHRKYNEL